ncbi:hypothetical protein BDV93DRAFT_509479 [Ceratobasidium sp. AG-I]|nr:hypothetical protein BDV93DRAFT_509479 [Ceratobasidium sp. AG-I]
MVAEWRHEWQKAWRPGTSLFARVRVSPRESTRVRAGPNPVIDLRYNAEVQGQSVRRGGQKPEAPLAREVIGGGYPIREWRAGCDACNDELISMRGTAEWGGNGVATDRSPRLHSSENASDASAQLRNRGGRGWTRVATSDHPTPASELLSGAEQAKRVEKESVTEVPNKEARRE